MEGTEWTGAVTKSTRSNRSCPLRSLFVQSFIRVIRIQAEHLQIFNLEWPLQTSSQQRGNPREQQCRYHPSTRFRVGEWLIVYEFGVLAAIGEQLVRRPRCLGISIVVSTTHENSELQNFWRYESVLQHLIFRDRRTSTHFPAFAYRRSMKAVVGERWVFVLYSCTRP